MNKYTARLLMSLLALSMLLPLAACGGNDTTATTMHLRRTEGTVAVSDDAGEDVPLLENLSLYNGYKVDTHSESYAWINLDDVKLTKMDEESEIAVQKEGNALEIEVKSGSLFFNVTQPLEDDETMDIHISTMLVGIRGTCGWVENRDSVIRVLLLEGTVECTAEAQTVQVNAGEMAELDANGKLVVQPFTVHEIPAFVLDELVEDDDLVQAILEDSGIDVLHPNDPIADAMEQYRIVISQADSYDYSEEAKIDQTWKKFIGYRYALVQMQPDDPIPTLLLEREIMDTDLSVSSYYARVFQYDPDTETVHQPAEVIGDGGIRGGLSIAGDGDGIFSMSWSGGTGEGFVDRYTLDGDSLNSDTYWTGNIFEMPDSITFIEIEWHEIEDLSVLDNWTTPDSVEAAPSDSSTLPNDGDRIVLTGTVVTYDYDGFRALQASPILLDDEQFLEASLEHLRSLTYPVIVLDTPQTLRLSNVHSDYYSSHEASIICFDEGDTFNIMNQYEGRHITFSIDPAHTVWPSSDPPYGQPHTIDIHIFEGGNYSEYYG